MIIRKLHIHNIASIADAEIDFNGPELRQSSIFLIAGETGAGKTTVLDSICLALYDKTPRMTSVSKEDIGVAGDNDEKYYTNDNSQFLRRGTGEGWVRLLFEANDGKDYEAVWAIQRNYKKPDKRLQKPTRSLTASDGSYAETNKRAIPDKIKELTGLDYDQFCRTVMLAQGEFTKFLKSDKSEKSEILEKLTGTEIYSEIGRKIASRYLAIKGRWEEIDRELKSMVLLSDDDIIAKRTRIAQLVGESASVNVEKTGVERKINWLSDFDKLTELRKKSVAKIGKLQESINSETYSEECRLIDDFNNSTDARHFLTEREACCKNLEKKEKLYPKLQKKVDDSVKKSEKIALDIKKIEQDLEDAVKRGEAYDIEEINGQIYKLSDHQNMLSELCVSLTSQETSKTTLVSLEVDLKAAEESYKELQNKIALLSESIKAAEPRLKDAVSDLEKVELANSKGVKAIRESLKAGDFCPVCGAKIEESINKNLSESMLRPLRDRKKEAEDLLLGLSAQKLSAEKLATESEKQINALTGKIKKQSESLEKIEKDLLEKKTACGYENAGSESLRESVEKDKEKLSEIIEEKRKLQEEAIKVHKEISDAQNLVALTKKTLEKINDDVHNAKLALAQWTSDRDSTAARLKETDDMIKLFIESNPAISEVRLVELAAVSSEAIKKIETSHKKIEDSIIKEKGAIGNIDEQLAKLAAGRPVIEENENPESLASSLEILTESLNLRQQEIGQLNEQLERDALSRTKCELIIKEESKAREEKDRWEGLYRLLGDTEGAKFRNIAQSFILHSLLENANMYMRNFTDRYTLTCNPGSLAILAKDCYRPSEPQPASILSGGESFMASLSLALALSNLRSGGSDVDVLFIDEGFGTLSPEFLNNVMDTLEKLHQIGGRKVGLISHVPEMKERIPVQIRVERESPALSRVSVVNME